MQVQLEKIPQFLKDNGQFCNWKYILRDGNQAKVPYMPGTTRRASVSDPSTFTAFETAASATGYDGIGIRVCGRIVGIDLDHCIEDGNLLPWAQTIVDRFVATYIEVSPSGKASVSSVCCRTASPTISSRSSPMTMASETRCFS